MTAARANVVRNVYSATHITVIDTNRHSRKMLLEMIEENNQAAVVDVIESLDEIQTTVGT